MVMLKYNVKKTFKKFKKLQVFNIFIYLLPIDILPLILPLIS